MHSMHVYMAGAYVFLLSYVIRYMDRLYGDVEAIFHVVRIL